MREKIQIDKKRKNNNMNKVVVKIEMSGNRYNAFDSEGKKWTSEIGTGTRKGAYEKGMALERRISKTNGNPEEIIRYVQD